MPTNSRYASLKGPIQSVGIGDITPDVLQNVYLRGLASLFVDEDGGPWPDGWWWWWISKGIERVEEGANVSILPRLHVEYHDYMARDYINFAYLELYRPPVYYVQKVTAIYPSSGAPSGGLSLSDDASVILDFPIEWVRLYPGGKLHLIPTQGTLSQFLIGRGGAYLPMVYAHLHYVPQLWRIEYYGGFYNQNVPFIVADAVYKAASMECLTVLSDTIRPPGVTSMNTNFDGLQRNYSFEHGGPKVASMFTSRLNQYRTDLYGTKDDVGIYKGGMIQAIRDRYNGILMSVA